jgi:hypothetical protein
MQTDNQTEREVFYSNQNFFIVHGIVVDYLNKGHIEFSEGSLRKVLFQSMNDAYRQNPDSTISELNKTVIMSAIKSEDISATAAPFTDMPKTLVKDNVLPIRDLQTNVHASKPLSISEIPKITNNDKKEVNFNFQRLSNSRENEMVTHEELPNFSEPQVLKDQDFSNKYEQIIKDREKSSSGANFVDSLAQFHSHAERKESEMQKASDVKLSEAERTVEALRQDALNFHRPLEEAQTAANEHLVIGENRADFEDARLAQDAENIRALGTERPDLNDLYGIPKESELSAQKDVEPVLQQDVIIESSENYSRLIKWIDISSTDRQFSYGSKETSSSFTVYFNSEHTSVMSLPRFSENPTLDAENGARGEYDLVDFSGNDTDLNVVTGWEDVMRTDNTDYGNIPTRLSNVLEIFIESVIVYVGTKEFDDVSRKHTQSIKDYPYLLLKIDEIPPLYESSNQNVHDSCCKLVIDKAWTSTNDNWGYSLLKPMSGEYHSFANPLAELRRLTMRLLTPDGQALEGIPDSVSIKNISILENDDGNRVIKIKLREYVNSQYFQINHNIRLQDIEFFKTEWWNAWKPTETGGDPFCYEEAWHEFREWMHQKEGHYIIGTESDDIFVNTIVIQYPYEYDAVNNKEEERKFDTTVIDEEDTVCISGTIVNLSTQTNFTLRVVTREHSQSLTSSNV